MKTFLPLLFVILSPLAIFAQDQLPPPLPGNSSPAPVIYSNFQDAYTAGTTAAKEQRWQDSLTALNQALPFAQTDQEKIYTQKWIDYVNKKMGISNTPVPSVVSTPTAIQEVNYPGGGYKSAKWGMTHEKTKEAILSDNSDMQAGDVQAVEENDSNNDYIEFTGESKTLKCFFIDNQLWQVEYNPGLGDDDEKSVKVILSVLKKKYGTGRTFTRQESDDLPVICHLWNDGTTEITFKMADLKAMQRYNSSFDTFPSSTVKVTYASKKLGRKAIQAAKQKVQKDNDQEEKDLKEKTKKVDNDL